MMVDFAVDAQRNQDKSATEAIYQHVLCALTDYDDNDGGLMAVYDCLCIGAGAESRQPLGLAVVGGLIGFAAAHAVHHASRSHLS